MMNERIKNQYRVNEQIRAKEVRIVNEGGSTVMPTRQALDMARSQGVDLVEISPNANPPVAKIVNWGKYQYQKMKEQQKNRRKAKVSELKQMRLGLKISQNDLEIKLRKIRKFLTDGNKVKIMIFFRGREMAHKELGFDMMGKIIETLEDYAVVEQKPQMAGRNLSTTIRSK